MSNLNEVEVRLTKSRGLTAVGIVAVVMGILGIAILIPVLITDFSSVITEESAYFYAALYTMSGLCLVIDLGLIVLGVNFVRGNTRAVQPFVYLMISEIVYLLLVSAAWSYPSIGTSVAAATGVANAGITIQWLTLFPIWGSLVARHSAHKISANRESIG